MSKKEQETRITVRFPSDLIESLRPFTGKDKDDRSLNWEIVQAVREYVARKQREEAKQDA
jgi:metal-responsive CopG/Arc/MetJ family transcriptional regulator